MAGSSGRRVFRVKDADGSVLAAFHTELEAETERQHFVDAHGYDIDALTVETGDEDEGE